MSGYPDPEVNSELKSESLQIVIERKIVPKIKKNCLNHSSSIRNANEKVELEELVKKVLNLKKSLFSQELQQLVPDNWLLRGVERV